jgi:AcrR family transcriptional regulator
MVSPMARKPAPGARDRILDNAARLFSEHGIHGVGLQQVIDECGCGKNLLYREFSSKDELVAAYLERCRSNWWSMVTDGIAAAGDDPVDQLMAVVRTVAAEVDVPDYRGCPFHNTHAEFPDPDHPAHRMLVEHLTAVRALLQDLAVRAGAPDPVVLADRIMLILDGLNANAAVLGREGAAGAAVAFADDVVRAAVPKTSRPRRARRPVRA